MEEEEEEEDGEKKTIQSALIEFTFSKAGNRLEI